MGGWRSLYRTSHAGEEMVSLLNWTCELRSVMQSEFSLGVVLLTRIRDIECTLKGLFWEWNSEQIPCPHPGRKWLLQEGKQTAMYWQIEARVVLDLEELPDAVRTCRFVFNFLRYLKAERYHDKPLTKVNCSR